MFDRKAQAALEYLMTYGWALVVIVIVIAALVFLINPSQIGATGCTGFSKFPIRNYTVSPTEFKFIVVNETGKLAKGPNAAAGAELTLDGKIGSATITQAGSNLGSLAANAEKQVTFTISGSTGDTYDLNLNLLYRDPDGYDRNASASCKGTI
jgi:hypothetical protein